VLHTLFQYDWVMKTDHLLGKDISVQSFTSPAQRQVAPVVALLLLPPIIGEFLSGSTHLTTFFLLLPQIGVYGCGALLIRDLVRHQRKGWLAILLLSIAFAVAEECVILQTSFSPLFAADPQHIYGRALGVSWIYLLWAVGYESIWSIVLPIQLTELIFPFQRDEPWLGKRGLVITGIFFLLASIGVWYLWTQIAMRRFGDYQPFLLGVILALAVVAALVATVLGSRPSLRTTRKIDMPVPWPWLVGLIAFVLGLTWFALIVLHYGLAPSLPVVIPVALGLAWAAGTFFLVRYWSTSQHWGDAHRVAFIFGALMASMLPGFVTSGIVLPIDFIGKAVLNVIAVLGLSYLAWKVRQRERKQDNA